MGERMRDRPLLRDVYPWMREPLCFVGLHVWRVWPLYRCCDYCSKTQAAIIIEINGERRRFGYSRKDPEYGEKR